MEWGFCGEFYNTLDEKGRIAFPSRLKGVLTSDEVWITKGLGGDKALVIYSIEEWDRTLKELEANLSIYNSDTRKFYRMFIAPAQKVSIDKNGRVAIPQSLREYASLQKECIFLGMNKIIELWDVSVFNAFNNASDFNTDIFAELEKVKKSSNNNCLGGGKI